MVKLQLIWKRHFLWAFGKMQIYHLPVVPLIKRQMVRDFFNNQLAALKAMLGGMQNPWLCSKVLWIAINNENSILLMDSPQPAKSMLVLYFIYHCSHGYHHESKRTLWSPHLGGGIRSEHMKWLFTESNYLCSDWQQLSRVSELKSFLTPITRYLFNWRFRDWICMPSRCQTIELQTQEVGSHVWVGCNL